MDDPDAKKVVGKTWVHWILSDIPPDTKYLDEVKYGKLGIGVAGKNSDRSKKYFGPCPPKNEHKYNIKAYSFSLTYFIRTNVPIYKFCYKYGSLNYNYFACINNYYIKTKQ